MKYKAIVFCILSLLFCYACSTKEPIIQTVEVTRLVDHFVEVTKLVEQAVEVTRVVRETIEVQVTQIVRVTQIREVVMTPTPPPPPSYQTQKLGEEYSTAGWFFLAEEIEDPAVPDRYAEEDMPEGHELISVLVIIGNQSGETATVFPGNIVLVDTEGFTYEWECCARADEQDMPRVDDMVAGEKVRGWISFIVPQDIIPAYLKYPMWGSDTWLYAGLKSEE